MSITFNHIAELAALATSIFYHKKIKGGELNSLPFFLAFILAVELIGTYLRSIAHTNIQLYNISIPVEYCYYFFLYFRHGQKLLKKVAVCMGIAIIAIAMVSFLVLPGTRFHNYVLIAGQVFAITCSCIYFFEQFREEEEPLLQRHFFWLASGLLLFNLGEFVYFIFFPIISANKWDTFDILFKATNNSLLILLYLSYMIMIITYKKTELIDAK